MLCFESFVQPIYWDRDGQFQQSIKHLLILKHILFKIKYMLQFKWQIQIGAFLPYFYVSYVQYFY